MTTLLHRRRQTGQRSRPCPFPRLQTSSPDEENTRALLLMFFFSPATALEFAWEALLARRLISESGCCCLPTGWEGFLLEFKK